MLIWDGMNTINKYLRGIITADELMKCALEFIDSAHSPAQIYARATEVDILLEEYVKEWW